MPVKELIEQIGGRGRLEEMSQCSDVTKLFAYEMRNMARALLSVLDAQEIGWVDSEEMRGIDKNRHATIYKIEPDNPYHDPRRQRLVYLTPPAASAPDGLAAAVNRLLDSDGSRGTFSAIRRGDALAEVEGLLAAAPATGVPDGWKMVPIEPTQCMIDAHTEGMVSGGATRAYRDMLAAAPEPGGDGGDQS